MNALKQKELHQEAKRYFEFPATLAESYIQRYGKLTEEGIVLLQYLSQLWAESSIEDSDWDCVTAQNWVSEWTLITLNNVDYYIECLPYETMARLIGRVHLNSIDNIAAITDYEVVWLQETEYEMIQKTIGW